MKSHYRVVVIGGGIVGASVLYHLTRKGWSDIALIERAELTAGSTWHAAAGFHAINDDPHIAALQAYTIKLYQEIEAESGQSVGMHMPGGYSIATTPERWEWLQSEFAVYQTLGIEARLATPEEIVAECPIVDPDGLLGGLFDPHEGAVDPHGTTHAFAIAARKRGADVILRNRVTGLQPHADGWLVETEQGTIIAQHVVNAGGLWARRVGRMVGVDLPLTPMQHHYLITEDLPELLARADEMPCVTDLEGFTYLQQERKGVILGVYERNPRHWKTEGAEWDYGMELLPEDIDRISPELLIGFARFPSLQRAGIRKWVNGAFTFTPDGNPLVGPVPGLRNFWAACGCMGGFSQGGAIGKVLSEWMVDGDPGTDIFGMDVARYGKFASRRPLPARHDGAVLRATLRHRLPQRRTARRPAAQDDAELRRAAGTGRALRRGLGHGVAAVFRDGRAGFRRAADVATVRRRSVRRRGSRGDTNCGGTAGYRRLRALRSARTRRGKMARPPARLAPARRGPHPSRTDAEPRGPADGRPHRDEARRGSLLARRFVLPAGVAPALVPRSPACLGRRDREPLGELARLFAVGTAVARDPRIAHARRRFRSRHCRSWVAPASKSDRRPRWWRASRSPANSVTKSTFALRNSTRSGRR